MSRRGSSTRGWGGSLLPTLAALALLGGCDAAPLPGETSPAAGGVTAAPGPSTTPATGASQGTETSAQVDEPTTTGTDPAPAPRYFTPDTPPGRYTLRAGESSTLRLPAGSPPPEVVGGSVEVFPIASVAATGFAEWELRASGAGETALRVGETTWVLIVGS